jgi:hypothetical protein
VALDFNLQIVHVGLVVLRGEGCLVARIGFTDFWKRLPRPTVAHFCQCQRKG